MLVGSKGRRIVRSGVPLVSVITPTYNREEFLRDTIESVLTQDYPRIEYIVLDDGSTDGTRELLRQYSGRLRWASHQNMGETATVNAGFSMAKGEYLAIVNSDDPILPGLVSAGVDRMARESDLLVVYPDWLMINEKSDVLQHMQVYEYNFINMLRWHHCLPGPGALIRREAIDLVGGRDPRYRYVADFEHWLRIGLCGPLARLPGYLATFRVHGSSASVSQRGAEMAEEHIQLMDNFFARPGIPPSAHRVKAEAYSAAYYIAAIQCMDAAPGLARRYMVKSVLLSRRAFPNGHARTLSLVARPFVLPLLGADIAKRARAWLRRLRAERGRRVPDAQND